MDKDAEKVHHPHNNAIVITLLIAHYTTRRVLVDNESATNTLLVPCLPTNEAWTRSTSSSKFTIGRIWGDESATHGYHYIICGGKSLSTTNNQRSKFPRCGLFVFIQRLLWKTDFEKFECNNIYLPFICQVPNKLWSMSSS